MPRYDAHSTIVYGPTIYAGLGYHTATQLALAASWVSTAFVASVLSMFIVDRVPRPKLIAGGMISCVIVLIVECILVARNPIGPDVNKSALKAAVAMIFCTLSTVRKTSRSTRVNPSS